MIETDHHPEDLKALLRKRYGSLRAFERQSGLPPYAAASALRRPHEAGERAIAAALGSHPGQIWPSRYASDGARFTPQPAANYGRAA